MLMPVSIVTRQGTFSTNASNKSRWKISFSSRPLFLSFEVLSSITGSRPLTDSANARFPDYLCFDHVHRLQTDCSSRRDSPDWDHVDSASLAGVTPRIPNVVIPVSSAISPFRDLIRTI